MTGLEREGVRRAPNGDDEGAWYFARIYGDSFDPRTIVWPPDVVVEEMFAPGDMNDGLRGPARPASSGFAMIVHVLRPSEADLFRTQDPIMRFLLEQGTALREAGVQTIVLNLGITRHGQLNSALDSEQLANLARARVELGISFYSLD